MVKIMKTMSKKQFNDRLKKTLTRGLIASNEYAENYAKNNYDINDDFEKMREEAEKQAKALQKFNGENILDAFSEAISDGAENYEEALQYVIEGHLLTGTVYGHFHRREMVDLYGHHYILRIIEDEFSPEVWSYVSPNDLGALIDLGSEAEARTHARYFYDLAKS